MMAARTAFLSKLIGIYCILIGLSMVAQKTATVAVAKLIIDSPPTLYLLGVMLVLAGVAMILGHNVWSGGALPVIVTVTGWTALIKGLLFLYLFSSTGRAEAFYLRAFHFEQWFYLYAAIALVLGIYLTYAGFRSTYRSA